jgi:glycosyltransferase involved in cell wall biosynthesis
MDTEGDAGATVLHYMQHWLPLSEQFVHAIVSGTRHPSVVVSRTTPSNRAAFPQEPVVSLGRLLPPPRAFTPTERRLLTAALLAIAWRHKVRLVHSHHGYRLPDVEGLVLRRRLPWVVSLYGHDATAFVGEWGGYLVNGFEHVDAVVLLSKFLIPRVVELGVPEERIHVIPCGVDTSFFTPSPLPAEPEVLFVGRFVEKKGIDVLLEAWPRVRKKIPDARLRFVGFGPLEHLVLAAGPGVEYEPADPDRRAVQLRDALRRARVVCTPSKTSASGDVETLLIVNLEAQASGRPVVTTWHGGVPEYVSDRETALLVPEADAGALAEALIEVLSDDGLAERLGAAGPGHVRQYDNTAVSAQFDALYETLL